MLTLTLSKEQINEAKNLDILDILASFGSNQIHASGQYVFVKNPFRDEKTPSFAVNIRHNKCFDYGEMILGKDKGLDSIELVMKLKNFTFKEAVIWLLEGHKADSFFFKGYEVQKDFEAAKAIKIEKVKGLENKGLIQYLESRKINLEFAKSCPLLFEVYFLLNGKFREGNKPYFALGFKNQSESFELRSANFKACTGKDISFIANDQSSKIVVFEGFMDYLTALTYFKKSKSDYNVLILNSVSNREKAIPILEKYDQVFCFLDRDEKGYECLDFFTKKGLNTFDKSLIYNGFKDFNEFLNLKF